MSAMCFLSSVGLAEPPTRRRRGRPLVSENPAEQRRHIECAGLFYLTDWPVKRIARACGVTRATAYRWHDAALTYDGPEADALRQLAARRNN